jgi:sugar lactone lactonase YvrE
MAIRSKRVAAVGAAAPSSSYDAFMSYSHAADGRLAPALQAGLQSLAKRWYRRRALRVFRDKTSLSASPELWPAIEQALGQARFFVLLASPEAARSPWVDREVRWWRAHRGRDTVLIVLTDGELVWEDSIGDFDSDETNAIPPGLRGWFTAEPLWVDLRWVRNERHVSLRNPGFRDALADLAAPLRGLPKDELVGEDIRQHRRVRRLARGAVTLLTVLTVLASSAAVVAVGQRNEARNQARIATSRLLAATSQNLTETHLDVARLLAVRAYRMDPNPQTRATLFRAVTASPFLVRYLKANEPISVLSGATNGKVAVAGTEHGRVLRWDVRTGARAEVAQLKGQVTSIGTNGDGSTITATDGSTVVAWTLHGKARSLQVPAGQEAKLVAVSPSGRFVTVYRAPGANGGSAESGVIALLDQVTQRSFEVPADTGWTDQALPSETETVLFSQSGGWQRLSLPDLVKMGEGRINVGAHNYVNAISPSGRFISFNNEGDAVMLWRTDKSGEAPDDPELTGRTPGGSPEALALSWDGKRTAIADTGTIYVSDTVPGAKPTGTPLALTGNDHINGDVVYGGGGGLRFFGDNNHLLSASGDTLAVWDLTQHSLISRRMGVTVGFACNACPGPQVSVSPDGQKAGVVDGNNLSATVRQLERSGWETVIEGDFLGATNKSLLWSPDGSKLLVEVTAEEGGPMFDVRSADRRAALLGHWGHSSEPNESTGVSVPTGDGRHVVTVGVDGAKTVIRDAATGAVEHTVLALSDVKDAKIEHAGAVNADATALALLDYHDGANLAKLVSLKNGRSRTIGSGPAAAALFSGEHLLVQRSSGVLEVWDATGTHLQQSIAGEPGYVTGPVANRQGTLVARERSDGTVAITDLESGESQGSFRLPAARKAGMAFGSDGYTLVTVTEPAVLGKGELQRWNLSEDAWVHVACESTGRDLTATEWRRYVGNSPPGDLHCG